MQRLFVFLGLTFVSVSQFAHASSVSAADFVGGDQPALSSSAIWPQHSNRGEFDSEGREDAMESNSLKRDPDARFFRWKENGSDDMDWHFSNDDDAESLSGWGEDESDHHEDAEQEWHGGKGDYTAVPVPGLLWVFAGVAGVMLRPKRR